MLTGRNSARHFSGLLGARGLSILGGAYLLTACQTTHPGIEVRTVEVVKEVQAPCPGTPPARPDPLGALPTNLTAALALTLAKLAEYSGEGKFADKAELYWQTCPPSE